MKQNCYLFSININNVCVMNLPLETLDREEMPNEAAVYLICDRVTDQVLYVGTSQNIRDRLAFGTHHIYDPELHIIKLVYPDTDVQRMNLEAILIGLLDPPLNQMKRLRVML